MSWRLARSLEQLRDEINTVAPGRSKASDGTIGDEAHASRPSDHNPNAADVVCAFDATHDPDAGADMHRISEHIRKNPPPAAKYVIWNRRIATRNGGWRWEPYRGSNPHDKHMHVSVGRGADGSSWGPYDDTTSWGISSSTNTGDDDMINLRKGDSGERVKGLQYTLQRCGFDPEPGVEPDGKYGPKTAAALLRLRKSLGSSADNGDKVTGAAYSQILTALARSQGGGKPGPVGPRGPAGPPGTFPKTVTITGTVTE